MSHDAQLGGNRKVTPALTVGPALSPPPHCLPLSCSQEHGISELSLNASVSKHHQWGANQSCVCTVSKPGTAAGSG